MVLYFCIAYDEKNYINTLKAFTDESEARRVALKKQWWKPVFRRQTLVLVEPRACEDLVDWVNQEVVKDVYKHS